MSRFLSQKFASIEPYVPGEQPQGRQYIKLNTNESPFPPAPGVIAAINREEVEKLRLYSDPDARALIAAIARRFGVGEDQVFVGNGSDEVLAFVWRGGEKIPGPGAELWVLPRLCPAVRGEV